MQNTLPSFIIRILLRFDASSLTASLVSSILQAANRLLVCGPAGNSMPFTETHYYLLSE